MMMCNKGFDPREIKAVSFDLDDTLWDCGATIIAAEAELYHWFENRVPVIPARYDTKQLDTLKQQFLAAHPELHADMTLLRRSFLVSLMRQNGYGIDEAEELAAEGFEVFFAARNKVRFYADTLEVLARLSRRLRLGALTNGNANLGRIGIDHLFGDIRSASISLPPKPAPDMFDQCAVALGVEPHQMLHVGDHPEIDIVGARRAGYRAAWFNQSGSDWPSGLKPADIEVASLTELADRLLGG